MSDLISKEGILEYLKTVTVTEGITFETGFKQILHDIETQPTADIMECARAMKSFCWKTDCANCPIFLQCGEVGVRPCDWDLPEAEANPNKSLIKDCCEAQGHLWADNNIFEDVEENQ